MRIETELTKTEDGQTRFRKSRDRIEHCIATSGEAILTEQRNGDEQCTMNREMRPEAETNIDNNNDDAEMQEGSTAAGQEEFDIPGSPVKEPEEIVLA